MIFVVLTFSLLSHLDLIKKNKWSCVFYYCYFKVEKIHSWRSQYEQINSLTLTIYFEKSKIGKTDDFFHLNRTSCWVTHFCLLLFSSEFFFFSETFFNSLKTWKKLLLKKFNYQFGSRKYTLNILLLFCLKSLRGSIENCKYRTTYLRIAHSSKSYYFEFWFWSLKVKCCCLI